uniref:Uncharacterized protein n=1 Tax=Anguilla anguilla TaxID=7936 RepID=A0A0E9XR23_ANGAN
MLGTLIIFYCKLKV